VLLPSISILAYLDAVIEKNGKLLIAEDDGRPKELKIL